MYEQFKSRAEGVGAEVHRFPTRGETLEFLLTLLDKEIASPGSAAVWAPGPFLDGLDLGRLRGRIPGLAFDVSRQVASDALIGISEMEWALADTGSLVADQTAVEQRLASTLPATHIALLPTGRILPGKAELFARINPAASRFIAFITGPSRTADIERVLTIGVHGPKRLIIAFTDEAEGAAL